MASARPEPKPKLILLLIDSAVGVRLDAAEPTPAIAPVVLLCVNAKLLEIVGVAVPSAVEFNVLEAAVVTKAVELELALVDCVLEDCELWCSSLTGVVSDSKGRLSAACALRVSKIAVLHARQEMIPRIRIGIRHTVHLPSIDAHGRTAVVQTLDRTAGRRLGHVAGILAGSILGH